MKNSCSGRVTKIPVDPFLLQFLINESSTSKKCDNFLVNTELIVSLVL